MLSLLTKKSWERASRSWGCATSSAPAHRMSANLLRQRLHAHGLRPLFSGKWWTGTGSVLLHGCMMQVCMRRARPTRSIGSDAHAFIDSAYTQHAHCHWSLPSQHSPCRWWQEQQADWPAAARDTYARLSSQLPSCTAQRLALLFFTAQHISQLPPPPQPQTVPQATQAQVEVKQWSQSKYTWTLDTERDEWGMVSKMGMTCMARPCLVFVSDAVAVRHV